MVYMCEPVLKEPFTPPTDPDFVAWKNGVDRANEDWDKYDQNIFDAVNTMANHLNSMDKQIMRAPPPYLDWLYVKAMLWTETNPVTYKEIWGKKPLQIGNDGDPGLNDILSGDTKTISPFMIPKAWGDITKTSIESNPKHNIQLAIAYLMKKHTQIKEGIIYESDRLEEAYLEEKDKGLIVNMVIRLGRIGIKTSSKIVVEVNKGRMVKNKNPKMKDRMFNEKNLQIGDRLFYRRGYVGPTITGWQQITPESIAANYNTKNPTKKMGDPFYKFKIRYAYNLLCGRVVDYREKNLRKSTKQTLKK